MAKPLFVPPLGMLADARRRLGLHLMTRTATADEVGAIHRRHLLIADRLDRRADVVCYSEAEINAALEARRLARSARIEADAWNCSPDDMVARWEATRLELIARILFYGDMLEPKRIDDPCSMCQGVGQ